MKPSQIFRELVECARRDAASPRVEVLAQRLVRALSGERAPLAIAVVTEAPRRGCLAADEVLVGVCRLLAPQLTFSARSAENKTLLLAGVRHD